ncbi:MAG: hypothetical protein PHI85_10510 [Victivallaceae bacterium]|nr:hypothetical protein [Victivallaceae bacterium]
MKKIFFSLFTACAAAVFPFVGAGVDDAANDDGFDTAAAAALTGELAPSMVTVNYYLKADEMGSYPAVSYWCPICSSIHHRDGADTASQAKPVSTFGVIVGENIAIAPDIGLPTENIDRIEIDNLRGAVAPAVLAGYFPGRSMVRLTLNGDIGAIPVTFSADDSGDLYSFIISDIDGAATVRITPFSIGSIVRDAAGERDYIEMPESTLIVNAEGAVVAVAFSDLVPAADDWMMPPADWDFVPTADRETEKDGLKTVLRNGVFAVKFKLAEPPKSVSAADRRSEPKLEILTYGILREDGSLLTPLNLSAQDTGRIDRITMMANGEAIPCGFTGAVKYFDAFVVRPESLPDGAEPVKELSGGTADFNSLAAWEAVPSVSDKGVNFQLLPVAADFRSVVRGYGNVRYPNISSYGGLVFDRNGSLAAAPFSVRAAGTRQRYDDNKSAYDVPIALNAGIFAIFDPAFAPKSEAERFMLGWLGADYQMIDPDLAEANDVLHLTNNGGLGLLVTDVSADSPAGRAGIVSGDVLLRVTPVSGGAPVELAGEEYSMPDMSNFPWSRYDELTEMYFDMIPFPWPDMNSGVNRLITSFGIGSEYDLAYATGGEVKTARLKVEPAPECFYNAKRFNAQDLGVTVCGITPEVRRYMMMEPDDPGVLIAGVKAGSKASVAGLKPYEMICGVDGVPVSGIDGFKKAVEGKSELKLEVKRLATSRIVSVKLDAPANESAGSDAAVNTSSSAR